ncbi:lipocalin-like domain-containing protein [Actinomadura decatromicini]|uniref:Lipocalin-like domain-containing protein n=1 Tax=Actinomadura decatromicini TaxID=2604572 RepID=A0A5D3F9Q5_9ACTN|nr:lipocalin-like domain-containing protein [Actinomadura decatromicini]TYK44075.1 lipocalin-like domain-containing protein [Actinomadura decatromicini]
MTVTVPVLGVWTLHAYHDLDEHGNACVGPLGRAPRGLLTYRSDGRMAVAMMRTEPGPSDLEPSAGLLPPMSPPEEFMSYSGTWRLEGDRRVVHAVEASVHPHQIGTEQVRDLELAGSSLTLRGTAIIDGRPQHRVLYWRRQQKPPPQSSEGETS